MTEELRKFDGTLIREVQKKKLSAHEAFAVIICDKAEGKVYINDRVIDGYVVENGVDVVPGDSDDLMRVCIEVYASELRMVDHYLPRIDGEVGDEAGVHDVGVVEMGLPDLRTGWVAACKQYPQRVVLGMDTEGVPVGDTGVMWTLPPTSSGDGYVLGTPDVHWHAGIDEAGT